MKSKITKSDAEWRSKLTSEQYRVAREGGTEMAFSGEYYHHDDQGMYRCVCCDAPLFDSEHKYESGSGWPSFWQPHARDQINELEDASHGMRRVEIRCANCDAHLGHVFSDGPQPSGLRYCVNSASLKFTDE